MDDREGVDAYLAAVPEPHRTMLARVRAVARDACPDAAESIDYKMPGLRLDGRLLLSYAAHRRHCSMYPASGMVRAALGEELTPYLAEKATIQFTAARPIPDALVRRIVEVRVAEVTGAAAGS